MTVIPQQYTLHCVTIGYTVYNITLYYEDEKLENYSREPLHSSNGTYDNTVTITWDTETINISTGSFNQSVNDDQMYTCNVYVIYNNVPRVDRTRYLTVKGIYINFNQIFSNILSSRICSLCY